MVEIAPRHIAYKKITNGLSVHTNHHIFPEIACLIKDTSLDAGVKSATRLHITKNILVKHLNEKGKVGVEDILALARYDNPKYPGQCPFRSSSVCASDFIATAENTGMLSTLRILPGPPKYTPAIPVPFSVTKIPAVLENGQFGKLAYEVKRNLPDDEGVQKQFNELERKFWKEYNDNYNAAKKEFEQGNVDKFKAMMQELLERQVDEAYKLLLKLVGPK